MPEYSIDLLDGQIHASTYNELVQKIRNEENFWNQFHTLLSKPLGFSNSDVPGMDDISEMLYFWSSRREELEEKDGRSLPEFFEALKSGIEGDNPPPLSTSSRAFSASPCQYLQRSRSALCFFFRFS